MSCSLARLYKLQLSNQSVTEVKNMKYEKIETESWFNSEIQKIVSVIAGLASAKMSLFLGTEVSFDARVFVIPPFEVCNYFIWRQRDWKRNSIQMVARSQFSQKALHGLSCDKLQEKLWQEKKINWAKLKLRYKRGTCVKKSREKWVIDEKIPDFIINRNYINKHIPEFTPKKKKK